MNESQSKTTMTKKFEPANEDLAFLDLLFEGKATVADHVLVDDGRIQLGSCDEIQFEIPTNGGDGIYPVWVTESGNYAVIELSVLRQYQLDKWCGQDEPEDQG